MEIRQLRSLISIVKNHFNVSRTANQLCVVQSAVSQQLLKLEDELGVSIFIRQGRKLTGLTEFGETVLKFALKIQSDTDSIKQAAQEHIQKDRGNLCIGATHTQARYFLPSVVKQFYQEFPLVDLQIHQGTPLQLIEMIQNDSVDFAICTEALEENSDLTVFPCYQWNRSMIVWEDHPLLQVNRLTLSDLTKYPLITYEYGFTGRLNFSATFNKANLLPRIVLSAADSDVIKTFVRDGLGVGIIASMAYQADLDKDLVCTDLSHLFPWETTKIAYKKDRFLRQYQFHFVSLFQSHVYQVSESLGITPSRSLKRN